MEVDESPTEPPKRTRKDTTEILPGLVHGAVRLALVALLALPVAAAGQDGRHVAVMAGRSEYDLSGVDRSNLYAVRLALPVRANLLAEGSLSYVHTRQQFGRTDLWIPEVQLQLYRT